MGQETRLHAAGNISSGLERLHVLACLLKGDVMRDVKRRWEMLFVKTQD